MILKHFQMCGHRPIALVGGATGMIGDPSGKSQERNLLDEETLRRNQEAIKRQLAKLIDFDSDAPNAALMVNNYDWMKGIGFLDFIRDIGKLITVNYMMAKDSVKKRFNGEGDGMSFTSLGSRRSARVLLSRYAEVTRPRSRHTPTVEQVSICEQNVSLVHCRQATGASDPSAARRSSPSVYSSGLRVRR